MKRIKITSSLLAIGMLFLLFIGIAVVYYFFTYQFEFSEDYVGALLCVILIAVPIAVMIFFPSFCIFYEKGITLIYLFRVKTLLWEEITDITVEASSKSTDYILHTENKKYIISKSRRTMKYLYEYWGDFGDDTGLIEFFKNIFKKKGNKKISLSSDGVKENERNVRRAVRDILKDYQFRFDELNLKILTNYTFVAGGYLRKNAQNRAISIV